MTQLDFNYLICENARPTLTPGATPFPAFLPDILTPNYIDLFTSQDLARADAVYANFIIASAFDNVAANTLRFMWAVDNDPSGVGIVINEEQRLLKTHSIASSGLGASAVGKWVSVPMPPLGAYSLVTSATGFRYAFPCLEVFVPTTDWSTGGITCLVTTKPMGQIPLDHTAGY